MSKSSNQIAPKYFPLFHRHLLWRFGGKKQVRYCIILQPKAPFDYPAGKTMLPVSIKPEKLEPDSAASLVQRSCRGVRNMYEMWHNSTVLFPCFTNTRRKGNINPWHSSSDFYTRFEQMILLFLYSSELHINFYIVVHTETWYPRENIEKLSFMQSFYSQAHPSSISRQEIYIYVRKMNIAGARTSNSASNWLCH